MRHPILVIYLAAVMLLAWQPWNFYLIDGGVWWSIRPPGWIGVTWLVIMALIKW
jgi:hypothetical protein